MSVADLNVVATFFWTSTKIYLCARKNGIIINITTYIPVKAIPVTGREGP
jgi:hypothetical protein